MALNFGETKSMYQDRGSREVSKILSDRYLTNFLSTEATRKEADNLMAAPFEGDQAMKTQLLRDTDEFLQATAKAGDYENMTTQIVQAAGNYQAQAAPIAENYKRYNDYNAKIDELVKEGDVPLENAELLKQVSQSRYGGLQMGEDGKATGFFSGIEAAADPDTYKLLDDALKGIKVHGDLSVTKFVGIDTAKGMVEVETEEGAKFIPLQDIQDVMDPIFARADVRGFAQQSAELRSMAMPDDKVRGQFATRLESLQESVEKNQAALVSETDEERKAEIQAQIDDQVGLISETGKAIQNDDLDGMRQIMSMEAMNREEMMQREGMLSKYGFLDQTYKKKYDRDKLAIAEASQVQNFQQLPTAIDRVGTAQAVVSQFGDTFETTNEVIQSSMDISKNLFAELQAGDLSPEAYTSREKQLQTHLAKANMGIDLIIKEFGATNMADSDREQYNALLDNVAEARNAINMTGGFRGDDMKPGMGVQGSITDLSAANEALQNFAVGKGYKRKPQNATYTPRFIQGRIPGYSDNTKGIASQQEKALMASIAGFLESNEGDYQIYNPKFGQNTPGGLFGMGSQPEPKMISMKDAILEGKDVKAGTFKIDPGNVAYSYNAPNGYIGNPTMEVGYTYSDSDGKEVRGSYRMPISDDFRVPGVNSPVSFPDQNGVTQQYQGWANQNHVAFKGNIEGRATEGLPNGSVSYKTPNGQKGSIEYRTNSSGGIETRFVTAGATPSDFYDINSASFAKIANDLTFGYGMDETLRRNTQ